MYDFMAEKILTTQTGPILKRENMNICIWVHFDIKTGDICSSENKILYLDNIRGYQRAFE